MSGIRNGVATQICKEEPRAVYTHCYGHSLNLAAADAIKQSKVMKSALATTHEVTKHIKYSLHRDALFQNLKSELTPDTLGVRVHCPTRWTVWANSLASVLSNYTVLQELWDELSDIVKDTETIAQINGVSSQMKNFDFFFGVVLGKLILSHTDNLSKTLQHKEFSASEGQEVATLTIRTLESIRNGESFDLLEKLGKDRESLEVNDPIVPRKRKVPQRFEIGTSTVDNQPTTSKSLYRQQYYEALDLITNCVRSRFNQPGYNTYKNLQELFLRLSKEKISNQSCSLCHNSVKMTSILQTYKCNYRFWHMIIQSKSTQLYLTLGIT